MLEGLLESWSEYENSVQSLKAWFANQERKLKEQHLLGDRNSVENALKDCQVTREVERGSCLASSGLCAGLTGSKGSELSLDNNCTY